MGIPQKDISGRRDRLKASCWSVRGVFGEKQRTRWDWMKITNERGTGQARGVLGRVFWREIRSIVDCRLFNLFIYVF